MSASPYRRAIVAETKKRSGKGGKGNWRERLRPPKDHATPLLLIAGDYRDRTPADANTPMMLSTTGQPLEMVLPYFPYEKHVRNLPSSSNAKRIADEVCSRGSHQHQPMPCVGCSAIEAGDRSLKLSDAFAVGLFHLVPYHGHPIVDRTTNTYLVKKEGQDAGKYVMGYDECLGRSCNYCRLMRGEQPYLQQGESFPYYAKDLTTVFGHRRYLDIGKNGLQDILGWDISISSTCFGPGFLRHPQTGQFILDPATNQQIPTGICGNQLTTVSWNCSVCNSMLIDMSTEPRSDAELQAITMDPHPCFHCQRPVDLVEIVQCDVCRQARQVNVFSGEVVVWVKRQGEGTASHMVLDSTGHPPFESLDSFLANPNNVHQALLPQGKTAKELVIDMAKPYDFEELMKPRDLASQSKRLELPVPPQFQQGQQQQFAQPGAYGAPPGPGGVQYGGPPPPNFGPPPAGYGGPQPPAGAPVAGQNYQPPTRPNYQQ